MEKTTDFDIMSYWFRHYLRATNWFYSFPTMIFQLFFNVKPLYSCLTLSIVRSSAVIWHVPLASPHLIVYIPPLHSSHLPIVIFTSTFWSRTHQRLIPDALFFNLFFWRHGYKCVLHANCRG